MSDRLESRAKVSLVILVRDQAAELHRLLNDHRPLFDEAVVVDTGSNDDSREVATRFGARLISFQWCDDFSAARNHGLARASGDWILVLDCDEAISPADFDGVRALCQTTDHAWEFFQRNYCGDSEDAQWVPLQADPHCAHAAGRGYIDTPTCRLFPNRPVIRYEGLVHELPNFSLAQARIPVRNSGLVVHHYGHLAAEAVLDQKKSLYGNILRSKFKKMPDDPLVRFEMAVQLLGEGRTTLAARLLRRAIAEAPGHAASHKAHLLLGRMLMDNGDQDQALGEFERAVRNWPELRESWIGMARACERTGDLSRTREILKQGRYLFPTDSALTALSRRIEGNG